MGTMPESLPTLPMLRTFITMNRPASSSLPLSRTQSVAGHGFPRMPFTSYVGNMRFANIVSRMAMLDHSAGVGQGSIVVVDSQVGQESCKIIARIWPLTSNRQRKQRRWTLSTLTSLSSLTVLTSGLPPQSRIPYTYSLSTISQTLPTPPAPTIPSTKLAPASSYFSIRSVQPQSRISVLFGILSFEPQMTFLRSLRLSFI